MKLLWKIIIGIPSGAAAIAIIGGLYLYFDSIRNKPLTKDEVTTIVKEQVAPLTDQIFFMWPLLDDNTFNLQLLKNEIVKQKLNDSSVTKRDFVNFTTEWRNDLKKNDLPIQLKVKE